VGSSWYTNNGWRSRLRRAYTWPRYQSLLSRSLITGRLSPDGGRRGSCPDFWFAYRVRIIIILFIRRSCAVCVSSSRFPVPATAVPIIAYRVCCCSTTCRFAVASIFMDNNMTVANGLVSARTGQRRMPISRSTPPITHAYLPTNIITYNMSASTRPPTRPRFDDEIGR